MKKRNFLKVCTASIWVTPTIIAMCLPAHATTSCDSSISISVEMPVPNVIITIKADKPNFSYSYEVVGGEISLFGTGNSEDKMSVIINDQLTGQFAGTIQVVTVSVTDMEGNSCSESFSFNIEG